MGTAVLTTIASAVSILVGLLTLIKTVPDVYGLWTKTHPNRRLEIKFWSFFGLQQAANVSLIIGTWLKQPVTVFIAGGASLLFASLVFGCVPNAPSRDQIASHVAHQAMVALVAAFISGFLVMREYTIVPLEAATARLSATAASPEPKSTPSPTPRAEHPPQ